MEEQNIDNQDAKIWIRSLIALLIFFVCFLIYMRTFLFVGDIPSSSMYPTMEIGDFYVATCWSACIDHVQRQEIIFFKHPDDPSMALVKRIIGMPGDTVTIKNNQVYVNGELLDEPYLDEPMVSPDAEYHVPENCYFMLGDNRNNSFDSRFWKNTYASKEDIFAIPMLRIYPLNRIAVVNN